MPVQGTDVSDGAARDIGTVLVGKDAVEVGLIDVGGVKEAVAELKRLIDQKGAVH